MHLPKQGRAWTCPTAQLLGEGRAPLSPAGMCEGVLVVAPSIIQPTPSPVSHRMLIDGQSLRLSLSFYRGPALVSDSSEHTSKLVAHPGPRSQASRLPGLAPLGGFSCQAPKRPVTPEEPNHQHVWDEGWVWAQGSCQWEALGGSGQVSSRAGQLEAGLPFSEGHDSWRQLPREQEKHQPGEARVGQRRCLGRASCWGWVALTEAG